MDVRRWVFLLLTVLLGAFAAPALAAPVPSFDCSTAKNVIDKTICGDHELSEVDAVMARLYAASRASAFGRGPSNELAVQREWLKGREECAKPGNPGDESRWECLSNS